MKDERGACSREHRPVTRTADWICSACNALNFARRTSCFKCAEPRTEDAVQVTRESAMHANVKKSIMILNSHERARAFEIDCACDCQVTQQLLMHV
jgi:hypothetical protein